MLGNRRKAEGGGRPSSVLRLPSILFLSAALLACDPPPPPTAAPTPTGAAGLYIQAGCAACHTIDGTGGGLPGPDLRGLADRIAAERGADAVAPFLRDAILEPDKELTDGYEPGLMPPTYVEALTDPFIFPSVPSFEIYL